MNPNLAASEPVIVERTFNAPPAEVWRAITEKDAMKQWYFDLTEFKAEVGFEFRFEVKHKEHLYVHLCRVTEVIPRQRLAYTWRYEGETGDSLVTWELFSEGNRTRLKLTHTGLETFPPLPAYARTNFLAGWTDLLGVYLKYFVETPPDIAAREIMNTRIFNVSRETMWAALTEPARVATWWGPKDFTNTIETMEVRPEGMWKLVMHAPKGANYPNVSVFKVVEKPGRLVFRHLEPVHAFQMTMLLTEEGGQTRLTWHMLFDSVDECQKLRTFITDANEQNFDRLQNHLTQTN